MKKLADLKQGGYFFYGGVQWVVLENDEKIGATLAIAAEPVFNRAFDEENRNDWRVSSLRRELNGPFFDALVAEGANRAAFLDWESDLTADNGMTDYGTATDKIALLSDGLYRKYRQFIPLVDDWCWTLTPWTCNKEYTAYVRYVNSSGAVNDDHAYNGNRGARPLCYLESSIFVSVPYDDETADPPRRHDRGSQRSDAGGFERLPRERLGRNRRRRGCFPLPVEAGSGGHRKGGSRDAGAEQHARRSEREQQRGGGGLTAPAPPPKTA